MDQIWTSLLQFINQLVSPDWGALVALVPIGVVLLVALYLVWIVTRFAKAGPTRRGKAAADARGRPPASTPPSSRGRRSWPRSVRPC